MFRQHDTTLRTAVGVRCADGHREARYGRFVGIPIPGEGRAAIVTGASSGIGEAIAVELARRGHQLVLIARRADRLHALAESLSPTAYVLPADLSIRSDRAALPGRVAALGVAPDILINNAGLAGRASVVKSIPEQQLNLVEVDVAAVVDLCSRFLPGMVERGRGAVLNVSSLAGFYPVPGQAAYGAAKAFVSSYTESLRGELRGTGVTASALCPGPVATGLDEVAGFSEGERAAMLPGFMWKSAEEVARAAINGLAADKGRVVPGPANWLAVAFCRLAPHERLMPLLMRRAALGKST
jgi:short-subunit dehydrogenase